MTSQAGVYRGARHTPNHLSSDWKRDGICDAGDFHLFFGRDGEREPERLIREESAKEICRMCPAVEACLAFAMEGNEQAGVWGGLGEDERKSERRRRMRGEAAAALKARQEKQAEAARAVEERRTKKPWLFVPADPARDLELLRKSDQLVADGVTMRDAAKELGVPRTTLTDARERAQKLLAGAS